MTADTQGVLVLLTGVVAIRLVVTERFLAYVRPGMRLPLLGAGIVLVLVAVATLLRAQMARRRPSERPRSAGAHDDRGPRIAWLLVLPLVAIVLIDPAPLGAFAAAREGGAQGAARVALAGDPSTTFAPLAAPRDGAVDLAIGEYVERVYFDDSGALVGTPVRLTGFAVGIPGRSDAFMLTRFVISCCAADAFPVQVIVAPTEVPDDDTWLEVVGTWDPEDLGLGPEGRTTTLIPTEMRVIEPPPNPYE